MCNNLRLSRTWPVGDVIEERGLVGEEGLRWKNGFTWECILTPLLLTGSSNCSEKN